MIYAHIPETRPSLLFQDFPLALQEIVRLCAAIRGHAPSKDCADALVDHLLADATGDLIDPESGFYHASHVAWNALTYLECMLAERL